jgi:hypothetical protein
MAVVRRSSIACAGVPPMLWRFDRRILSLMTLRFWRKRRLDPLPEGEEREALKYERQYEEEQSSVNAIFKRMGRENLDGPFRRD